MRVVTSVMSGGALVVALLAQITAAASYASLRVSEESPSRAGTVMRTDNRVLIEFRTHNRLRIGCYITPSPCYRRDIIFLLPTDRDANTW